MASFQHVIPIYVQRANAKPHIDPNYPKFLEATSKDGFDIRLYFQPPNNLDLNILDLKSFRASRRPTTIDELVQVVERFFDALSPKDLNHVFLILQQCMVEMINVFGTNNYKVSHMGKLKL